MLHGILVVCNRNVSRKYSNDFWFHKVFRNEKTGAFLKIPDTLPFLLVKIEDMHVYDLKQIFSPSSH